MKAVAILPARMGSTRFPGKPLAKLLGKPMIQHVWERVSRCRALADTVVATCDSEIALACKAFGAPFVMTSDKHERASDRVAEAARKVKADAYVLVQGDEPMTSPEMVEEALAPLADPAVACVNLAGRIQSESEFEDRNCIKVVLDLNGNALMFSREPIPTRKLGPWGSFPAWKQVCVMPFRADALELYARLAPTPLEKAESVDMLRFLEHGIKVRMAPTGHSSRAVDTPEDLARVEALMRELP
ncbi:MAG: 3-deoxy-manno-octulosonate cytidylyltransferase [Elusimicrobia bacterium]|nr:3-deoxy-manno-octulosonate cytidylyltransferase [Elusimicrobiota bacterium]